MTYQAQIPYGAYWSTPFARWQGSFANLNSVELAAHVAKRELEKRAIPGEMFDYGVLGMTIPQHHSFYGLPWFMGLIGAPDVGGPTINQACATGTRALRDGVACQGAFSTGCVGPRSWTTGVPTSDATCMGPVSLPM